MSALLFYLFRMAEWTMQTGLVGSLAKGNNAL